MKYSLLISFLCLTLWSNAQTNKSDEPYFRIGVLGNYYLCKKRVERIRSYTDGSTEFINDTTDLTIGGLGFYSTMGYAFGNGARVGVEWKGYAYNDKSYSIGLFALMALGATLEFEASDDLILYTKFNWNFDSSFKGYSNRKAYSIGVGGYIVIPDYEFAMVRLNLEYMTTGGSLTTYYDYDVSNGAQLSQVESTERYRGLVAELGLSIGF